jgi:hypothetical protein
MLSRRILVGCGLLADLNLVKGSSGSVYEAECLSLTEFELI